MSSFLAYLVLAVPDDLQEAVSGREVDVVPTGGPLQDGEGVGVVALHSQPPRGLV